MERKGLRSDCLAAWSAPASRLLVVIACLGLAIAGRQVARAEPVDAFSELPIYSALSKQQWQRVDSSVDRGLAFLAAQQHSDGSFPTAIGGQPAVTSLAIMAFLSRGHKPGSGPYDEVLARAIDFVLSCQEPDGLIALDKLPFTNNDAITWERRPHTATYNHAISGIMLGEVYGMCDPDRDEEVRLAIEAALAYARKHQTRPPQFPTDKGGFRYLYYPKYYRAVSDLSVTGWFVMFYRSAQNAGFDVPVEHVDEAVAFIRLCHDPKTGAFLYGPEDSRDRLVSRGMTGAGLLSLTLAGQRDDAIARAASQWLLDHPFDEYNVSVGGHDRFHYGAYYCSQAMYMVGGNDWAQFYRELSTTLLENQLEDGGWQLEASKADDRYGRSFTTSLAVLSLTPPYQLLPIYQR